MDTLLLSVKKPVGINHIRTYTPVHYLNLISRTLNTSVIDSNSVLCISLNTISKDEDVKPIFCYEEFTNKGKEPIKISNILNQKSGQKQNLILQK